ncbi:regulator of Vps4 activity in the MVB pathway-domain-containing protein [Suillus spraguei]|nr:regulator of Vps4 activity in the MVB pathway-domain-containing protein [Suillus spraguei]
MPPSTWNAAKAKVQGLLSVQRLRIAQQKKEAHAKGSRRDIALLLEKGKIESARVKVEAVINEDVNLELYELLELYCELLIARFGLLDQKAYFSKLIHALAVLVILIPELAKVYVASYMQLQEPK